MRKNIFINVNLLGEYSINHENRNKRHSNWNTELQYCRYATNDSLIVMHTINGHARETNILESKEKLYSYTHAHAHIKVCMSV